MKSKKNVVILVLLLIIIILLFINNKDNFISTNNNSVIISTPTSVISKLPDYIISGDDIPITYLYIYNIFNDTILVKLLELTTQYNKLESINKPYKVRGHLGDIQTVDIGNLKNYFKNHINRYKKYIDAISIQIMSDYDKFFKQPSSSVNSNDQMRRDLITSNTDQITTNMYAQLQKLLSYIEGDLTNITSIIKLYNQYITSKIIQDPIRLGVDRSDRYSLFAMYDTQIK